MTWLCVLGITAALCVFGAVLYRAGRTATQLELEKNRRASDEQADKMVRRNSRVDRASLLDWLRNLRTGR